MKSNRSSPVGVHRARQHTESPATKQALTEAGIRLCERCGAVGRDKHWYAPDKMTINVDEAQKEFCPGCYRVEREIWDGEVVLEGNMSKTGDALKALIKHVEDKCWHDNPTSRLWYVTADSNRIEIKTTTQWLAMRIGRELKKAFKGDLEIKRSPEKNYVRVFWVSN